MRAHRGVDAEAPRGPLHLAALERMPQSHAAYKENTGKFARSLLESILGNAAKTTDQGFCYGDDARADLLELAQKIIYLLATGTTLFDASIQSAAMVSEKSTIAQADGGFQQMLRSVVPAD